MTTEFIIEDTALVNCRLPYQSWSAGILLLEWNKVLLAEKNPAVIGASRIIFYQHYTWSFPNSQWHMLSITIIWSNMIAATASTADDNRVHNWRRRTSALECSLSELKRKYSPVGLEQGAFCHKKLQLLCFNDNSFINITLEIFENNQWLIQLQYKDTMNCPEKVVKISHFN